MERWGDIIMVRYRRRGEVERWGDIERVRYRKEVRLRRIMMLREER